MFHSNIFASIYFSYVLYYNLDKTIGYIDGMIPLILAGLMMGAVSATVFWEIDL